jgi:hypothetical protein
MHIPHAAFHDVLVAGTSPVGLFLACELRLAGCSVLVLEQAQDPHSPLKELPFGGVLAIAESVDATGEEFMPALTIAYEVARHFTAAVPVMGKRFNHVLQLVSISPAAEALARRPSPDDRAGLPGNDLHSCRSMTQTCRRSDPCRFACQHQWNVVEETSQ